MKGRMVTAALLILTFHLHCEKMQVRKCETA